MKVELWVGCESGAVGLPASANARYNLSASRALLLHQLRDSQ